MVIEQLDLAGRPLPKFAHAPSVPAGYSPHRRPGSARRTMSIDTTWPDGRTGVALFEGHARDIVTSTGGGLPRTLREDHLRVRADGRIICNIIAEPPRIELAALIGERAGGHLRAAIDRALPDERDAGTPLYLMLDDLAGATLVAGWAWSRWIDDWMGLQTAEARHRQSARMEGVCIGFRPGSTALFDQARPSPAQNATPVVPLPNPADPMGWHHLPYHDGVNFRRARRIDVWLEEDLLQIDSSFQDSASTPSGERIAIHEYHLVVTADANTQTLLSVAATPGTLPYRECPAATVNLDSLCGTPLRELRGAVLRSLPGSAGCTHLNDAMRALAEVPQLSAALSG